MFKVGDTVRVIDDSSLEVDKGTEGVILEIRWIMCMVSFPDGLEQICLFCEIEKVGEDG